MRIAKLGDIATIDRRSIDPSAILPNTHYLGLEHLNSDGSISPVAAVNPGDLASSKFRFTEAHVLYGKLRPYLRKIVRPTQPGICSTDILPILPGQEINRDYLYQFLRLDRSVALAASLSAGANLPRLNPTVLESFEIPLPPLPEQRRIAAILDHADALRAKRRAAIAKLDSLAQSIFHFMIVRGLKSGTWPVLPIEQTGRIQLGRQRAPQFQTGRFTRKYVRVANVFEDRLDLTDVLEMDFDEHDFQKYRLQFGDILLNEGQSTELVGRPAMWRNEIEDCCFQNTLIRFQPNSRLLLNEFALAVLLHYFRTGEFAKISSKTSSVAHLGASRFARIPIPVPPLEVQQRLVAKLDQIRAAREHALTHLTSLASLAQSLQFEAFSNSLLRHTPAMEKQTSNLV